MTLEAIGGFTNLICPISVILYSLIPLHQNIIKTVYTSFSFIGKSTYDSMKEKLKEEMRVVASNIRKIREYRNYTQDYLAAKLEISQNAYSKIELGYSKLTLDRLFHIAIILDVDVKEILYFNQEQFKKQGP